MTIPRVSRPVFWLIMLLSVMAGTVAAHAALRVTHGLRGEYFANDCRAGAPVASVVSPVVSTVGMVKDWNGKPPSVFSARWFGYLVVGRSGAYTFSLSSDDGATLSIDGNLLIDNGGVHRTETRAGHVTLARGPHLVVIEYAQAGGPFELVWEWARDEGTLTAVPAWALSPRLIGYDTALMARVLDLLRVTTLVACSLLAAWISFPRACKFALQAMRDGKPVEPALAFGRDSHWAGAAGIAAFIVYGRTLAPGLVGIVDTPVFQFVGRVLGVPHNPGYPLYVFLTFPFSYLPVGTLPYRINLFSAILSGVTVSLTFLIARRLGCGIVISLAAALGLAFGRVYWSQSVIAEVYTLNSAIVAGMLLALLAWGRSRDTRSFVAAIVLFAMGLGNHLTIVGFAPGMIAYALFTDCRFVARARTFATVAVIMTVGLLQYGFIILRSRDPGAYVESKADTVSALFDVMRGRQFGERLFAFDLHTAIFDRVPFLVERVLVPELTLPVLVLALSGMAYLMRKRVAEGLLFLLGFGAIFGFAVNYSVSDIPVFLIPGFLVLWLGAAVGAEQMAGLVRKYAHRAGGFVIAAAVIVPIWNVSRNFAANDRSYDFEAQVHFDALFEALPDRTVLVREDFLVDRMVSFKLLGDRAAKGREILLEVPNAPRLRRFSSDGFSVFAFYKFTRRLNYEGMDFDFAPYPLTDGPLPQFLSRLPRGTIVAIAVPALHAARFAASGGASFGSIGGPSRLGGHTQSNVVIVGVRGARRGAVERTSDRGLIVDVASLEDIGTTGFTAPTAIRVQSEAAEAAIRVGPRDSVRTSEGVVLALWNPVSGLRQTFVLQAKDEFRVPVPDGPLTVHRLRGTSPSQELPVQVWTDVTAIAGTGSLIVRIPPGSTAVLYAEDDSILVPRVVDQSSTNVRFDVASFDGSDGPALLAALKADGAGDVGMRLDERYVYRLQMSVPSDVTGPVSVQWALGGVPAAVVARVSGSGPSLDVGTTFSIDTTGLLRRPDLASEILVMSRGDVAQLTGYGWSAVDADENGPFRWTTDSEARVLLPLMSSDLRRITVQAFVEWDPDPGADGLRLRLNGTELRSQPLVKGWQSYDWSVQPGTSHAGVNEALVVVQRQPKLGVCGETPSRGIAVSQISVAYGTRD